MFFRTKESISYNMSKIKSKNTKIERILGQSLWQSGIRYRKNCKDIYGKPDFAIKKYKIAIFCDSAFWHGYKNMKTKVHNFKSNRKFWIDKINSNIERDKKVNKELKSQGWIVLRFWDFNIVKDNKQCIRKIVKQIER